MNEYMIVLGWKKILSTQKFPGESPQVCLKIDYLIRMEYNNYLWNIKRQSTVYLLHIKVFCVLFIWSSGVNIFVQVWFLKLKEKADE